MTEPTEALQDKLYKEFVGRIKQPFGLNAESDASVAPAGLPVSVRQRKRTFPGPTPWAID